MRCNVLELSLYDSGPRSRVLRGDRHRFVSIDQKRASRTCVSTCLVLILEEGVLAVAFFESLLVAGSYRETLKTQPGDDDLIVQRFFCGSNINAGLMQDVYLHQDQSNVANVAERSSNSPR